jgi:hypothetical protein
VERGYLRAPGDEWCGFQAYYAQDEADVRATSGPELVNIMLAVFDEVSAALSLCSRALLPAVVQPEAAPERTWRIDSRRRPARTAGSSVHPAEADAYLPPNHSRTPRNISRVGAG